MKPENRIAEMELVERCRRKDRRAQKELYDKYSPAMKSVCRRYLYQASPIEQVMNAGFFKVFTRIGQYKGTGTLGGWIKTIMINECLNENKRNKVLYEVDPLEEEVFLKLPKTESYDVDYIMLMIRSLPSGYGLVFNLYEVEGYKHREIAKMLGITESSSRSHLTRAKQMLREKLRNIKDL